MAIKIAKKHKIILFLSMMQNRQNYFEAKQFKKIGIKLDERLKDELQETQNRRNNTELVEIPGDDRF